MELSFNGDKSLSHRAALLATCAKGKSRLTNYLRAEDTMATLQACEQLGAKIEDDGNEITIDSPGIAGLVCNGATLNVGNSGTGARLLLGLLSGLNGANATIDGDRSLRSRPMKRITAPLETFGGSFSKNKTLPMQVTGAKLQAIDFTEELGSAQVKSALMLAGLSAGVSVSITEEKPSRDHTENMLEFVSVPVGRGKTIEMKPPYEIKPAHFDIWGDISAAAFFVVLGLLRNKGETHIKNVLLNPYRDSYLSILQQMGGRIEVQEKETRCGERGGDIIVHPSSLKAVEIEAKQIPALIDELPILTMAGLFATGDFSFRNAAELRVKESDRIAALVQNLRSVGVEVEEFEDGLLVQGDPDRKLDGEVHGFHDHRIVMSFEIAQERSRQNGGKDLSIAGKEWVATSFPDFYDKLGLAQ